MLRGFIQKLSSLFSGRTINDEFWSELEETMVLSDIGVSTTEQVISELKSMAAKGQCKSAEEVREFLKYELIRILGVEPVKLKTRGEYPLSWLVVGVNGTGKTTTVGKLGYYLKERGFRPLLVGADTFRAAAIEQLQEWGTRAGVPVLTHQMKADPAAVCFDAYQAARARGHDILVIDTAGRLHTKFNLMEELRKISRVLERAQGRPPDECLLVLDGSTGQNGLLQAESFLQAVPVSGVIVTKLDGTAKGGIVITIRDRYQIPIKMVGVGEKIGDLVEFDPRRFVNSIFNQDGHGGR
jgi:fused signal recognition particle receptor